VTGVTGWRATRHTRHKTGWKRLLWWLVGAHAEKPREPVGAPGADCGREPGACPRQVVGTVTPARRIGGRVVLTFWRAVGAGWGGYGRGGRGSPPVSRRSGGRGIIAHHQWNVTHLHPVDWLTLGMGGRAHPLRTPRGHSPGSRRSLPGESPRVMGPDQHGSGGRPRQRPRHQTPGDRTSGPLIAPIPPPPPGAEG
jgi:hypothetical protein